MLQGAGHGFATKEHCSRVAQQRICGRFCLESMGSTLLRSTAFKAAFGAMARDGKIPYLFYRVVRLVPL